MVTGELAAEINGLRKALGSAEVARIGPHITVVPPVNLDPSSIDEAVEWVRAVSAGVGPLPTEIGPAATFFPPNPVVYLAVTGAPEVLGALADLDERLASGPLQPPRRRPKRPFVPHVTINQRVVDPGTIPAALASLAGYRAQFVFERVTVIRFHEAERRWLPIAEAALAGPSVVGRGGYEVELSESHRLDPAAAEWSRAAWDRYSLAEYGPDRTPDAPFAITARVAGVLAGAAVGEVRRPVCRLGRLMVGPEHRGTGIGTHLLQAVEQLGRRHGCERLRLETLVGGRAMGFYAGRGYNAVGLLPRWRGERDFVIMERPL
jgi:2'-5' RNA ligase/ribosomal protein S18 acetylase RimI-like enzyme